MILKIANCDNKIKQDILAADIGATKTNIALIHWNGNDLLVRTEATYKTQNFTDAGSLIDEFIGNYELPAKICLAVAGPVQENKVTLTNINLQIDSDQIAKRFHRDVLLVNDLEASAYSLAVLDSKDIQSIHEGERKPNGNVGIISPGTGLGEAGLYFNGERYHPFATEGGHSTFSPRIGIDIELYHFIKRSFEHVSWERIISGPGICNIYDFLLHVNEWEETSWIKEKMMAHDKASVISENVTGCAICKETMDMFVRYLAEESANLVLKLKATGGLFIGGGIIPHLIPIIHKDNFLKHFSNFGRLKNLLQAVPISIILNKKAALFGAAYYGLQYDK